MITINNMSMPKSCADCRCTFDTFDGSTECRLGAKMIDWSQRPEDCPLVEFERPKAEWVAKEETHASVSYYCSNCKLDGLPITPYCPWCGAEMRWQV